MSMETTAECISKIPRHRCRCLGLVKSYNLLDEVEESEDSVEINTIRRIVAMFPW